MIGLNIGVQTERATPTNTPIVPFEEPTIIEYGTTPYDVFEFSPFGLLSTSSYNNNSTVQLMGLEALASINSIFTAPNPLNMGMTAMSFTPMLMANPFIPLMGMTSYTPTSTARTASSGDISNTVISSLWNVQYQGADRLETYGDSNGEIDYNNIPSEYYIENGDGSLTLRSNGDDGGSANSKYPRTELREKKEWDIMRGNHKIEAEYTDISGGRQTIMQIHFSGDAPHANEPPIRLEMINGELVVETRQRAGMDGSDSTSLGYFPSPTSSNPLNVTMDVIDGKIYVIVNGDVLYEEDFNWEGEGPNTYFKAGTYNHSGANTSVTMSSIDITHL